MKLSSLFLMSQSKTLRSRHDFLRKKPELIYGANLTCLDHVLQDSSLIW